MHCLHYVWFQNNPGQVNIWVCISYSEYSNAHTTPVRIYHGELYVHKFCAVDIFLEYHLSSSNITRCQVQSHVRAFHDSAGDVDFYQMRLGQSESTILHESIIWYNMDTRVILLGRYFHSRRTNLSCHSQVRETSKIFSPCKRYPLNQWECLNYLEW